VRYDGVTSFAVITNRAAIAGDGIFESSLRASVEHQQLVESEERHQQQWQLSSHRNVIVSSSSRISSLDDSQHIEQFVFAEHEETAQGYSIRQGLLSFQKQIASGTMDGCPSCCQRAYSCRDDAAIGSKRSSDQ